MKQKGGIRAMLEKLMKHEVGGDTVLGCDVPNHLAELSCALFQQDCALGYVVVVWYVLCFDM
jgi:hypothetical protein